MPRPSKWRMVAEMPQAVYFKPAGVPMRLLGEVILAVEEAEALRLKDLLGMEQQECAEKMGVSRPTFHRILRSAHHKVATALVNGSALRIEGGNFALPGQQFRCVPLGHRWRLPLDALAPGERLVCPDCLSSKVLPVSSSAPGAESRVRGWGQGRGRRQGGRWRGGTG